MQDIKEREKKKKKETKMEPLFIGILITLTVCASHPLETTKSPLDIGNNAILSNSKSNDDVVPSLPIHKPQSHTEEIRLNITLKSDENDKEVVDIDMGMYKKRFQLFLATQTYKKKINKF